MAYRLFSLDPSYLRFDAQLWASPARHLQSSPPSASASAGLLRLFKVKTCICLGIWACQILAKRIKSYAIPDSERSS
ncbi:hypothetical protein BDN70DRAFT_872877 [Pholiota conissans]|uniref:Uncharacterized protein n=1 Tax=Pholiota conissans TaxID=109636 RepID=A0A9P6D5N3_9AGAR|nr:hypothetical protein BDN70DRAFT_872877 [Pholiota conissans]